MDHENLTDEQFAEMVEAQCSPTAKRIAGLERENAKLRELGEVLRNRLNESRMESDPDDMRAIEAWDALPNAAIRHERSSLPV